MAGRVQGKVAFITGAARGQGRSHAIRLAQEGADIIAIDFLKEIPGAPYGPATQADMDETVGQVEALDRRIIASVADVRDYDSLKKAVDDGVAQLGKLDIVSANAGISTPAGPAEEISEALWSDMVDTNLSGVWRTAKATIPHLKANGSGSVILTSSDAGLFAMPSIAHYVSAKHGVVGLMRTLALELAPFNVRVNSIHPTNVNTDMIQNEATYKLFLPQAEHPTKDDFAKAALVMNAMSVPWVEAVDISNAVLWLASDESRYVTGVPLPVDAGANLKN
jgi:(+)-trans-carveol dehydrogenase